jgi:hypothetical protein
MTDIFSLNFFNYKRPFVFSTMSTSVSNNFFISKVNVYFLVGPSKVALIFIHPVACANSIKLSFSFFFDSC